MGGHKLSREWQKGAPYVQGPLVGELNASGSAPNPMDHALEKKRKTSHSSDSIFHKKEPHGQASPVVLPFPVPVSRKRLAHYFCFYYISICISRDT